MRKKFGKIIAVGMRRESVEDPKAIKSHGNPCDGAKVVAMDQVSAKRVKRLIPALLVVSIMGVFSIFGPEVFSTSAQEAVDDDALQELATPVRLITLEIEEAVLVQRQFLGRLEARQSTDVAFEFGGSINSIAVREGERVKKGDTLASLRTDSLVVERAGLQAILSGVQSQFDFIQEEFDRISNLVQRGAVPARRLNEIKLERNTLESRLLEVESGVEQLDLRVRKSEIVAPFDGIVGAMGANLGETVGAGQSIATVYESGGADLRVGLPTSLDPSELLSPQVKLNDRMYDVSLKAIRPDIDFRTNTRVAIFSVDAEDLSSFGLSATLSGDVSLPVRGAWVPLEAMRPSAQGYWIVLAVNEAMVAERVAIEIQYLRTDEAYVIGAFETGTQIIGAGAHKVVPGQTVRAE